jgi:hypothetical protein
LIVALPLPLPFALAQEFAQTVETHAADDVLEDIDRRLFLIDVSHSLALHVGPAPLHIY